MWDITKIMWDVILCLSNQVAIVCGLNAVINIVPGVNTPFLIQCGCQNSVHTINQPCVSSIQSAQA